MEEKIDGHTCEDEGEKRRGKCQVCQVPGQEIRVRVSNGEKYQVVIGRETTTKTEETLDPRT